MLPKTHLILGIIFLIIINLFFKINLFESFLILSASVFIDFDHYIWFFLRKKDLSLKNAFEYFDEKLTKPPKPVFVIFHTVEFLILVLILSSFWKGFLFIFIGMIFHSILDIFDLMQRGILYSREFFLIKYLLNNKKNYF